MDSAARTHIDAAVDRMLVRVATAIERDAQAFAPVDTGELRGSIRAGSPMGGMVRITASADHSVYVELGTRHQAAQPYLSPALNRERAI